MDLEIQIEALDQDNKILHPKNEWVDQPDTEIYLDTDNFDGATYYFEAVGSAPSTSDDISIYNSNFNGEASCTNFGTIPTRRRSASYTPNNNYKVKRIFGRGGFAEDRTAHDARVIVVQSNATKTELQIAIGSLVSGKYTSYPSGSSNFGNDKRKFWYYDSSVFSTTGTTTVEMEAIGYISSSAATWYGCVKEKGSTSALTNGEVSGSETAYTRKRNTGGITLSSGTEYEGDFKSSSSNKTAYIAAVRFIYRMTATISKVETYIRCGWEYYAAMHDVEHRCLFTENYSGTPSVYYESTGYETSADADTDIVLRDHGTNDSGQNGTNVSGSELSYNSTSTVRKRSSGLSLTSGNRFHALGVDSASHWGIAWIIVQTAVVGVVETIIAKDFPMGYIEKPVKAEQLTSKVEGATVQGYTKNFPRRLVKAGKQKELESEFTA